MANDKTNGGNKAHTSRGGEPCEDHVHMGDDHPLSIANKKTGGELSYVSAYFGPVVVFLDPTKKTIRAMEKVVEDLKSLVPCSLCGRSG